MMFWLKLLAVPAAILLAVFVFGPREPSELKTPQITLSDDLDGWLAEREQDIRPELAARIEWAEAPGQQTDLAIIYLHGFSGSPAELRPLPQDVAAALGANLYSVRLTGHAQDGAALAKARLSDWWQDTAEAVAIASRLGRRVVLIGLSTGATLAAEAVVDPDLSPQIDAVVLMSPNFGVQHRWAWVLDLPYARKIVRVLLRQDRCFETQNEAHEEGWTSCYAIESTLPMAALVRRARKTDYTQAQQPAFFIWSEDDQVVQPEAIHRVADDWGGPLTRLAVQPGPRDDPYAHVIGGDALSPDLSPVLTRSIIDWIKAL